MIFGKEYDYSSVFKKRKWKKWYAWRPVLLSDGIHRDSEDYFINGKYAWLQYVERRKDSLWGYDYREI